MKTTRRRCFTAHQDWLKLLATILVLVSSTSAFDGNRKGFVAGVGLGLAPVAHWSATRFNLAPTEVGLGANSFIGYAWNNYNSIVFSGNGCIYKAEDVNSTYFIQGLDAISWYHYWGANERTVFTTFSAGRFLIMSEYDNLDGTGFGYGAAIGYDISKWFQVGLYYIGGHTSNGSDIAANHSVVNLLLTFNKY